MTREEFDEMERLCKKEWKELAETGNEEKSERMNVFHNQCPACHIANGLVKRDWFDDGEIQDCRLCPVDVWRKLANENLLYMRGEAACEGGNCVEEDSELFALWITSHYTKERQLLAKQISELSWSWLPEYADIKKED